MTVRAETSRAVRRVGNEPVAFAKELIRSFTVDECHRRAAALSYYMMFAIPSVLIMTILLGGVVVGEDRIEREMTEQATRILGSDVEEQVRALIQNARRQANFNLSALISVGALLIGALGAFSQLQSTFNAIWNVRPKKDHSGITHFLRRRAFSLGMIVVVVFLVLFVLLMTSASVGISGRVADDVKNVPFQAVLVLLNGLLLLAIFSVLFMIMFSVLPDAKVHLRHVWLGALITAVLFLLGQVVIVFWLGQGSVGSTFGAASSVVIVLIWIYYSGMIIFAGAEFTRVLAKWQGYDVQPNDHAERIEIVSEPGGDVTEVPQKNA